MRQDVSRYIISCLLSDLYQSKAQDDSTAKRNTQTQVQEPRKSSQPQRGGG